MTHSNSVGRIEMILNTVNRYTYPFVSNIAIYYVTYIELFTCTLNLREVEV